MFLLSTGSLYNYSLGRVFALGRRVGFDGIEVIVDSRWDTREATYLRFVCEAHGLPVLSLHAPFVPGIQGWESDAILDLERTIDLAAAIGARIVVAHLPRRWHWLGLETSLLGGHRWRLPLSWPQAAAYARWLQENRHELCCATNGVQVLVETMPARRLLGMRLNLYDFNYPDALMGFDGLVLDTTHIGTWGVDVVAVYDRMKARIKHIHLSDYDGREHLPLAQLLNKMATDGYQGCIVLESGPEHLGAGADEKVEQALSEALAFCQEHFRPVP